MRVASVSTSFLPLPFPFLSFPLFFSWIYVINPIFLAIIFNDFDNYK